MNNKILLVLLTSISLIQGCARLDFGDDKGLVYYDPKPYLFVSTTKDCVTAATNISLPETKKEVKFLSGYGSADLSIGLSNGMITSAGQKTDTKIPETLTAVSGLVGSAAKAAALPPALPGASKPKQIICTPSAAVYPINNGIPDISSPLHFPVTKEVVDVN